MSRIVQNKGTHVFRAIEAWYDEGETVRSSVADKATVLSSSHSNDVVCVWDALFFAWFQAIKIRVLCSEPTKLITPVSLFHSAVFALFVISEESPSKQFFHCPCLLRIVSKLFENPFLKEQLYKLLCKSCQKNTFAYLCPCVQTKLHRFLHLAQEAFFF